MAHVRANCWVNYSGDWHKSGDVFEVADADKDAMVCDGAVTVIDGYVSEVFPPEIEKDETPKKQTRRGRPKKTD